MARPVRPARGLARLAAVAASLLLTAPAFAQPEGGTTLYLVVRTKPSVPDKRVIQTIDAGLDAAGHTIDGRPVIKPVSPVFFEQFAELIGSPTAKTSAPVTPDGKVGVAPLPSRDGPLHELRLPSPKQTLTKLSVRYQPSADSKQDVEEYAPKQPGDGPLTLIEPGRYAFRPAAGRTPMEYTATVDERDDKTKELVKGKEIAGEWPAGDKFYVVTLRNFRRTDGGRPNHERFLREIEQQNQNTANPVTITRLGGDQLFVFADMAGGGAQVGSLVVGNSLELRVPSPVGRNTRRAWVLFPLSETAYQEALNRYANFPTTDLPGEIRKNSVAVGEGLEIGPDSPAKWIEVPPEVPNPTVMYRRVPLKDLPGLAAKYPSVWQITVYEFEKIGPDGTPMREAIQVKDASQKDVSAVGSQIVNWATELKRANK